MIATALAPSSNLSLLALIDRCPPPMMEEAVRRHGAASIAVAVRSPSDRNLLAAQIDRFVNEADRSVLIIANGAGCLAAAWWARLSPSGYVSRVAGGIMVDPARSAPAAGSTRSDWFNAPVMALPFPSVLVASTHPSIEHHRFAAEWGSNMVADNAHTPTLTGKAMSLIERLTALVVARDVEAAQRLMKLRG